MDGTVSMQAISEMAQVSWITAKKYCDMYDADPFELSIYMVSGGKRGPSADFTPVIDEVAMSVLLFMYSQDPSTSLLIYKQALSAAGIDVCESAITKSLLSFGMKRGMPNLHPVDKWSDDNCIRLGEYLSFIRTIDPRRMWFFDEFSIDGNNVWRRKVRMNPFTGQFPSLPTDPSFRTRFNVMSCSGLCPQNGNSPAMFSLNEENGDAYEFVSFMVACTMSGVFAPWTVGVMDNASIHKGEVGRLLEEWLWNYVLPDGQPLRMIIVFLPTRFFELNPQELVIAFVKKKCKNYSLIGAPMDGSVVPSFVKRAFAECTVDHVLSYFRKCGYGR